MSVDPEEANSSAAADEFPLQGEDQVSRRCQAARAGRALQGMLGNCSACFFTEWGGPVHAGIRAPCAEVLEVDM